MKTIFFLISLLTSLLTQAEVPTQFLGKFYLDEFNSSPHCKELKTSNSQVEIIKAEKRIIQGDYCSLQNFGDLKISQDSMNDLQFFFQLLFSSENEIIKCHTDYSSIKISTEFDGRIFKSKIKMYGGIYEFQKYRDLINPLKYMYHTARESSLELNKDNSLTFKVWTPATHDEEAMSVSCHLIPVAE